MFNFEKSLFLEIALRFFAIAFEFTAAFLFVLQIATESSLRDNLAKKIAGLLNKGREEPHPLMKTPWLEQILALFWITYSERWSYRVLFAVLFSIADVLAFIIFTQFVFDWSGTLFYDDALRGLAWTIIKCAAAYILYTFRAARKHNSDGRASSVLVYLALKLVLAFNIYSTKFKTDSSKHVYVDFILDGQGVTVLFFFSLFILYFYVLPGTDLRPEGQLPSEAGWFVASVMTGLYIVLFFFVLQLMSFGYILF